MIAFFAIGLCTTFINAAFLSLSLVFCYTFILLPCCLRKYILFYPSSTLKIKKRKGKHKKNTSSRLRTKKNFVFSKSSSAIITKRSNGLRKRKETLVVAFKLKLLPWIQKHCLYFNYIFFYKYTKVTKLSLEREREYGSATEFEVRSMKRDTKNTGWKSNKK